MLAADSAILGRQVALLYRNLRLGQIISILNALFVAWVAQPHVDSLPLIVWTLGAIAIASLRLSVERRYSRSDALDREKRAEFWRQRAILGALLGGLIWAAGAVLLTTAGNTELKLFTAFVMAGMVAGAVPVVAADLVAFRCYAWPIILAVTAGAFSLDRMGIAFSAMSAFFLLVVTRSTHFFNHALHDSIRLEYEQARLAQGLDEARIAAEGSLRAKTEFLSNISHELRTPLNGIIGVTDLLRFDASSEQRELLDDLHLCTSDLHRQIENLITLSELEAGRTPTNPSPLILPELLNSLVTSYRKAAEAKGLTLDFRIAPELDETYLGDVSLLLEALEQLMDNAIKFTESGPIELTASESKREGSIVFAEIRVIDSGAGISPETLENINGLMLQADSSLARRHGGIGIGLAIVRRIVALMGGELRIDSTPGQGSSFGFVVPLTLAEPPSTSEIS